VGFDQAVGKLFCGLGSVPVSDGYMKVCLGA
jgi:hypothetical protein